MFYKNLPNLCYIICWCNKFARTFDTRLLCNPHNVFLFCSNNDNIFREEEVDVEFK